eukprot:TRINITY_DN6502_c0_g1_i2.p1 TRINITY_DN6502_c0_g1~~TRINITY_DN6502_c0_g1_i2.p1  ORF type:complete len:128 (-),score=43.51 TRINITY_DN6502_c0_g1_i2:15-359(-)
MGRRRWVPQTLAGVALLLNCVATLAFAAATASNYPGARALLALHRYESKPVGEQFVYIDVAAAQTGISRFLERGYPWKYSTVAVHARSNGQRYGGGNHSCFLLPPLNNMLKLSG